MMVNLPCLKGSCPNFLRPTCSYTECQLSFRTGSCPTERTTASYSSCFYLILLTDSNVQGTDIQWTLHLVSRRWPCCWWSTQVTSSWSGYFPEPCSNPDLSESQQGSGMIIWATFFCYAATGSSLPGLFISAINFFGSYTVPFVRIV